MPTTRVPARRHATRLLALLMALTLVTPAAGEPGDISQIAAPVLGASPPKAQDIADGDASVSTQTGALNYSFPIRVPPGRNGMAPSLSIDYSSQAAIYGGIAAGWSMTIPDIRWDTSKGRMRYFDTIDQEFIDEPYVSGLSGGRPLVAVDEQGPSDPGLYATYRAKNDSQFISYRRTTPILDPTHRWRALTPEGTTHYFGEPAYITNASAVPTLKLTHVRSPLTRSIDPFQNTIEYYWSFDGEELRIDKIRYTTNPNLTSLQAFGEVQFVYDVGDTCAGYRVGSQIDYTTGLKLVDGKSRLTQIVVKALNPSTQAVEHTRQITLAYGATKACTNGYAPFRQLASIQESAWHTPANRVDMPPVTFEYGAAGLALASMPPQQLWGGGEDDRNLSWGHRYQSSQWTSVEAMMVDFDGDGLVDRMENASVGNNCAVEVLKNDGQGHFNHLTTVALPRLPWQTSDTVDPVIGEGCFVNYQHTMYQNVLQTPCGPDHNGVYVTYRWIDMTGDGRPELVTAVSHDSTFDPTLSGAPAPTGQTWPTCTGNQSACPALQYSCMQNARQCTQGNACEMSPSILNGCISSAPVYACSLMAIEVVGNDDGSTMRAGAGECGPGFNPVFPHKLSCGLYPWVWYRNTGLGIETSTPNTRLQPMGLESDAGDSSLSAGSYVGFQQGILDIDGDGFVDSVVRARWEGGGPPPPGVQPYWWWAYLGDGNGGFLKDPVTGLHKKFFIEVPDGFWVSRTTTTGSPTHNLVSTQQLVDINGDGTADYLNHEGTTSLNVHYNDGLKIRAGASASPDYAMTPPIAGTTLSHIDITLPDTSPHYVVRGTRTATARLLDLDQDGRADLFRTDGLVPSNPSIQFNAGGDMLSAQDASAFVVGARQQMKVDGVLDQASSYTWAVKSDLIDLNGDGIPELVDFTSSSLAMAGQNANGQPPRLLNAIVNGRGLRTNITYAAMSDTDTVDNTVGTTSTASPNTLWVVKKLETVDTFESSIGSTTYFYDDPVFGANDEGRYAFRGFKTVTTTNVRGAKVIERYGFATTESPDWSGQLVSSVTQMPDGAVSIADQTWQSKSLFGGKIVTYHPLQSTQMTCNTGLTEAQCRATPAGRVVSVSTLTAMANTAAVNMLWVETQRTLQDSVAYDDSDRRSITTYQLYNTPYRLRPTKVEHFHRVSGTDQLVAASETTWDSTYRVPLLAKQRLDAAGTFATTERTFDMNTGNVLTIRKPVQYDAAGPLSTNTYDARQLFVTRVVNELVQDRETDYEYGTGAAIAERGPNLRSCDPNCPADPPGAPLPRRDGKRITVDGFGRPTAIEIVTAQGSSLNVYEYALVETSSYADTATPTVPTSITGKKLIEYGTSRWTEVKTELDGHGRPIRSTEKVNGTAPTDAITSYDYDVDGALIAVSVPDPSQNTSAQVTYTYTYDALGRPTGIRRPDSTTPALRSGADVTYDGLVQTETEVVAPGDGVPGATKLTRDVYGRLVRVDERTATTPSVSFAATIYAYSPRNEVTSIVDPTGVTTLLQHDFAGRRTKITRGTREWKYTYDKNGNMRAEATPPKSSSPPNPPNAADIAAYTTMYVYDALDRMTSKAVAPRDLSPADQELFGTTTVTQDWDGGEYNRMGHVVSFRTRGPANVNVLNGRYFYDPEGNTSQSNRTWNIGVTGGTVAFTERGETYRYGPFGALRRADAADGNGTGTEGNTQINTIFDDRGNPSKLQLLRPGLSSQYVGVQTRNVAGRVTKRRTDQPTQTMTFIESNWTYDKLGRVTSQVVQKNGPTQIARQDLAYFGTDDPKSLDHYLDVSNHKKLEFTYDQRHQLLGTTETAAGGAFSASNTFDLAGRFTNAVLAPTNLPGREARPRDVRYVYGAADPEAVSQLTINSGTGAGTPYATYTYDEAGNQVTRTYYTTTDLQPTLLATPQTWQFVYDGEDQLRRVASPDGTIEEYWYHHDGQRAMIRTRPTSGPIVWRWFHDNTEVEWQTDDLNDNSPTLIQTQAYLSLGTPVARVLNRNDRTEYQFHGLASNTLTTIESGIGDATTVPASGTVNAAFLYSPFGEILESVGAETTTHRHRVNDKYQDASSGLSYYGARYYDAISMQWTQADPLSSIVPDAKFTDPRLNSRYAFSLQNPVRYADPDGRQPEQVVRQLHIPNKEEYDKIGRAYEAIAVSARKDVQAGNTSRGLAGLNAAIQLLVDSFNVDTSGASVHASILPMGIALGYYDRDNNQLIINGNLVGRTGSSKEMAVLISTIVHESVHAATTIEQRNAAGLDKTEFVGYEAERIFLKMLLDKGAISGEVYKEALRKVNEGQKQAQELNQDWCQACLAMPGMHTTEDVGRMTYKRRVIRSYIGLWGIEANPSGPGL